MPVNIHPISAINGLSNSSPCVQIATGAASGFLSGFILLKVGKMVAISIGGTILIFEIAVESGLIKTDWNKVLGYRPTDLQSAIQPSNFPNARMRAIEAKEAFDPEKLVEKVKNLITTSGRFCVSFIGGFFLGFGLA